MYGGAPYGSLAYGATFGGVIVMPDVCDVTDWMTISVSASSWVDETLLSSSWTNEADVTSTWTTICDGDPGSVT